MMDTKQTFSRTRDLADARWGTRFVTANTWQVQRGLSIIRMGFDMAKEARRRAKAPAPVIRESFTEAMARQGVDTGQLPVIERGLLIYARVYGTILSICLVWALLISSSLLSMLASLCAAFIAGLMWMTWSLRLWQVRHQTLCSLRHFLSQPGWWKEWLK